MAKMGRPVVTHEPVEMFPRVPKVPYKDFDTFTLTKNQWMDLWEIIGPSVRMNVSRDLPLWKIITSAYAEGINHGSGIERSLRQTGDALPRQRSLAKGLRKRPTSIRSEHRRSAIVDQITNWEDPTI